ncbi:MAG: hypothetical protein FWH43_01380 [Endomicrobia bacterium]|nr:hypothetical protein [Endomicrobiia bacterium]
MKKTIVFLAMFAMLFSTVSCSKDNKKKGPNQNPELKDIASVAVSINRSDYPVDDLQSLVLKPGQAIPLKATVKDINGIVKASLPVNWTATSGLSGSFSSDTGDATTFTVGSGIGASGSIIAEIGGIFKTIPVIVDILTVNIQLVGSEPIVANGSSCEVMATLVLSGGSEDKDSIIIWNSAGTSIGSFGPSSTRSGDIVSYNIPEGTSHPGLELYVIVNGIDYHSKKYEIIPL